MQKIRKEIQLDSEYLKVMKAFKEGKNPKSLPKDHPSRDWTSQWDKISLADENGPLLIEGKRAIIPVGMQLKTVKEIHEKTHGSIEKTVEMIRDSMIWKTWILMIKEVCKSYEACQVWRVSIPEGKL